MAIYSLGSASISTSEEPHAQRESTALEAHLLELKKLNSLLYSALERSGRCADRLLGPQPTPVGSGESKDAGEPPLLRRLEIEVMQLHSLTEGVHRQIERFERI